MCLFRQRKSGNYGALPEVAAARGLNCGADRWSQTWSSLVCLLVGFSPVQPRRGPPRCGSCEGLRLIGVTTSQEWSLLGRRGEEEASLRERWPLSTTDPAGIIMLEERRRLAGLDPELRERSCTDLGLDPALTLCTLLAGEVPDPRKRGSAGATSSGKPRGGEGVRRGGGRFRSSWR